MKHISISGKVATVVVVLALTVLGAIGFATYKMRSISTAYGDLSSHQGLAAVLLARSSREMVGMRASIADLVIASTEEGDRAATTSLATQRTDFVRSMDATIGLLPDEAAKLGALEQEGLAAIDQTCAHTVDLGSRATAADAVLQSQDVYGKECVPAVTHAVADLRKAVDELLDQTRADDTAMAVTAGRTINVTWALTLGGLALVLAGALLASRIWISKPLTGLVSSMSAIANGDFATTVVGEERRDEIGAIARVAQVFKTTGVEKLALERQAAEQRQAEDAKRLRDEEAARRLAEQQSQVVDGLAAGLECLAEGNLGYRLEAVFAKDYEKLRMDFNAAVDKLQDTMAVVATNTAAIRSGSTEISVAADDLSRRTEQQAASLEETAAALDQITATVKKTSEGAHHARQVVAAAKSDAEHSGEVVARAVEAMTAIETSSQQVSQIIGVIDEIAFQTNLLALNAGVEAARAGEAGRGFAVVASEVRALAQRSAEAAKEIKALIAASGKQVGEGVGLVGETGASLRRIVIQIADINTIVSEIASSALEQATGLDQVNTAVNQMDQVTQQNAAMVEQSTAASHGLAQETEQLARLIGGFKVSRAVEEPSARPARVVAALKTTGRGGAARKVVAASEPASWEEF